MTINPPSPPDARTGGNDAVAFTSGPAGAPFSAGVVHAWLAADRRQPLVATGISMGALSAAAMRRVYQELEHLDGEDLEVKRWRWFQRYHQAITDNPFAPLWKALPDPVDFFAETPPVKDPSLIHDFPEKSTYHHLLQSSEDARRHFYLLVRLGGWLGTLPTRVSSVATALVLLVRSKEGYGRTASTYVLLCAQLLFILAGLWLHLVFSPRFVNEAQFKGAIPRSNTRPLFGWEIYSLVALGPPLLLTLSFFLFYFLVRLLYHLLRLPPSLLQQSLLVALCTVAALAFLASRVFAHYFPPYTMRNRGDAEKRTSLGTSLIGALSANLDISQGLLHPFQMQHALFNLFVKGAPPHVQNGPAPGAVKALFVCAALQEIDQISLNENYNVVDALTAALAAPGLLPPQKVSVDQPATAAAPASPTLHYDAIDGAAVRNNPIPAFFTWCRSQTPDFLKLLERPTHQQCSLHVIYSVPTAYEGSIADAEPIPCPDIVDSAFIATRLARRRDTRQEVRQANTISRLEIIRREVQKNSLRVSGSDAPAPDATQPTPKRIFSIFADEIAPRQDIDYGNDLAPDSTRLRTIVADGCRISLETLYHQEIQALGGVTSGASVPCPALLSSIAPRRAHALHPFPGLPAVCQHCPKVLQYRAPNSIDAPQQGILQTFGGRTTATREQIAAQFPGLASPTSKVIFLGSGGVFRGAFHIGVIAAIQRVKLYPDLVVGASVGTLMGGALCRITAGDDNKAAAVLTDLTNLFIQVDQQVSLTSILKSATKQLGTRARAINLSPAELARKIKAGSQADAGYAATGAPPELTDAISSLLTIPHTKTIRITSAFVAGHFSAAIAAFLKQVRQETLPSFNIQNCIMGVSLLEVAATRLLQWSDDGHELQQVQPYLGNTPSGRQVAFFGTTSFLNSSTPFLLGRDFLSTGPSWSTVQQGLSSSAFPAVFAARSEADLLPGVGRSDRFFADGGMFDNLPFFPALEVIAEVQRSSRNLGPLEEFQATLRLRSRNRNLIVCAGLNEKPERDLSFAADTLSAINKRAKKLSYESKTNTFLSSSTTSNRIFDDIVQGSLEGLPHADLNFLNGYVPADIVGITPTDAAHINGTFAFCKTLGMQPKRIQASIADGCFQTLTQLSLNPAAQAILTPRTTSVTAIAQHDNPPGPKQTPQCPYFRIAGAAFRCPFTETTTPNPGDQASNVPEVYEVCCDDPAHSQQQAAVPPTPPTRMPR